MKNVILLIIGTTLLALRLDAQEIYSLDSIYSFKPADNNYYYDETNVIAISYDDMGRIESGRSYEAAYGSPLSHNINYSMSYTENGNQLIVDYYDEDTDSFEPGYGFNLTYNENGDSLLLEETIWMDNQWTAYDKTEFQYDANMNLEFKTNSELNSYTSEWELYSIHSYTYDSENRIESDTRVVYFSPTYIYQDWKRLYEYDGNVRTVNSYTWDYSLEDWTISSRNVYTYDGALLLERYYQTWLESTLTWSDPSYEMTYTYDADDNLLSKVDQFYSYNYSHQSAPGGLTVLPYFPYYQGEWENHFNNVRLTGYEKYNIIGADNILDFTEDYFYSEFTGNISSDIENFNSAIINSLSVFPNPAHDVIFINDSSINPAELKNVEVLDVAGRSVHYELDAVDKLNVSMLPIGPYVIRGEIDGQMFKTKFVKK